MLGAVLLLAGAFKLGYDSGEAKSRSLHEADRAAMEQAMRVLEARYREKEQSWQGKIRGIEQRYLERVKESEVALEAELAAVGTEQRRLREQFRGCQRSLSSASEDATPSRGGDAAREGGLSPEDESVALRIAHDADAVVHQLHACQAYIREVVNG